jgi:F-type H+-transporting ATPase subunit b
MQETIQTLGIYWPKLIAQMINFGIVLFVLWRFAYRPILALLEQRRRKIEESVRNADQIKAELTRIEASREKALADANAQASRMIEEARAAAAKVQESETQRAIAAAEQIIAKAREAAALDHQRMLNELRREIGQLVVRTTGAVAGKVLTPDDQKRLIEETNKQLAA